MIDGFKLFDIYGDGKITIHTLNSGFNVLGIHGLRNEIDLFFKRYDSNHDYVINYLEFVDAFTPKDKIYANHLANKRPNSTDQEV